MHLCVESRHPRRRVPDVKQFLSIFVDIVLWRRGPQDLPVSGLLFALTVAAYVAVSIVQLAFFDESLANWLFYIVLDPLLLMGWTWLILRILGRDARFLQTASALFGANAVLGFFVYLPLQVLGNAVGAGQASGLAQTVAWLQVIVFALVSGRILKLATDTNLFTGIMLAITYVVIVITVLSQLRGPGD
jgi:hypothetical protein